MLFLVASLADLVVDLQVNTAALRKGLDDAKGMFDDFGKKIAGLAEGAVVLEALKTAIEAVAKAGEFMEQGLKDAAALGNGPSRELLETFEKVGLSTRQLGADLMSDLAPAFNSLIKWFSDGADLGKVLSTVAYILGEAFRTVVAPIVIVAGAIKGLVEGGNLESAFNGAATAIAKLAEHGSSFAGSMKTAAQQAAAIANMQKVNTDINIGREATRMSDQFQNLSGNRRQDKFAGDMTANFPSFNDALDAWKRNMKEAADLTEKAAVAESFGSKITAEGFRLQADQATQAAGAALRAADGWRFAKEKLIVDTAEINKIQLKLTESVTNIGRSADIKSQQFHNNYDPTAGFKDFDDALAKQTAALDNQAGLMAAADAILQQFGPTAQGTVDALKGQADNEGRLAQSAGAAADAFFAVKDRLKTQLMNALQTLGDSFLSNIGTLGKTIGDVIKGAQSGGIWGALAAAIMDLLAQVKGWTRIQNIATGQMQQLLGVLSSGLDSVIDGLRPLMGALGFLTNIVGTILSPILGLIGQILKGLAPIFVILGMVLKPLGDTFGTISNILGSVLKPVLIVLTYIFLGIGEVMLAMQLSVDYVILAFELFVNWVDSWFGSNNNGGVADATKGITDTIQQMKDLAKQTPDSLGAVADASANASEAIGAQANAANDSATALSKMNQELTNVPAGIKVALDRFNATNPSRGSGGSGQAGGHANTDPHGAGTGYEAAKTKNPIQHVMHIEQVVVQASDMGSLYKSLKKHHERVVSQSGGGPPVG